MKCQEIHERMPELAAGFSEPTTEENKHVESCAACAEQLEGMRATMMLLDEWQTPEPSPYFDVRLQARLREEMAKPQTGWLQWFRHPVLAAAMTVLLGIGIGLFLTKGSGGRPEIPKVAQSVDVAEPGTAVGDLQDLDDNNDLYANFELLDDLDLQQDDVANP